uniref:Cystatin domain-containing protein n=1 Tax=Ditylenchus dipsaci TaxID=166011 RepID=A0A915DHF6_9BILA
MFSAIAFFAFIGIADCSAGGPIDEKSQETKDLANLAIDYINKHQQHCVGCGDYYRLLEIFRAYEIFVPKIHYSLDLKLLKTDDTDKKVEVNVTVTFFKDSIGPLERVETKPSICTTEYLQNNFH